MAEKPAKFPTGALLIALGIGLAAWISWPLPKFLSSAIPYTFSARPDERVAGMVQGDHLQYLYHLHLLREAVDGRIPPFSDPYEFAGPYHRDAPYIYFPFALPYVPFSYVSAAFGYNVLVLLSFVGTMVAGYGLARAWGANRGSAVCAAIVLTLFPYRLNSLFGGHAAGSSFFLFPMAWWGLEKNWQTGRKGWGIMAALSLVAMSIQDVHFLFFFCLLLPFWVLWKLLDEKTVELPEATRREPSRFASAINWQGMSAAALLAASTHFHQVRMRAVTVFSPAFLGLLLFFFLAVTGVTWLTDVLLRWLGMKDSPFKRRWLSWPWVSFWIMGAYFAANAVNRPAFGSKIVLASLVLFALCHIGFLLRAIQKKHFSPGRIHVPWNRVVRLWPSAVGLIISLIYPLYLKLVVFARSGVAGGRSLFDVSLFSIPFHKMVVRSPERGVYVGWGLVGFILIGMAVLFASRKAQPAAPEKRRLRISLVMTGLGMILACGVLLATVFPLYNVLFRLVPFLSYIRSTGKYLILTATGGAVALALILTFLERTIRSRLSRAWLAPLVGIILLLDYSLISKAGVSVLRDSGPLYERVKNEGKGTRLLELPIWPGDSTFSAPYLYGAMLTGVPTINGYSPMVPLGYKQNIADPLYHLNFGVLGKKEFDLLKSLNVRFVNFHQELFPPQVSALPATHSLKRLLLNPNLRLIAEEDGMRLFRIAGDQFQDVSTLPCNEAPSISHYVPYDVLKHQVGEERDDEEAVKGKAWYSDGKEGFLFFGPFLMLPPGEYVAVFRVRVQAPREAEEVGYLDVYTGEGTEVRTRHPLRPSDWPEAYGYRFLRIPFRVTQPHPVQTRGYFNGGKDATVSLDFVIVERERQEGDIRLEAEDFFSPGGGVAKDDDATQGICLKIAGTPTPGEPILEETFIFLSTGRYELRCAARGAGERIAILRMRRVGATSHWRDFDVQGSEGDRFHVSGASLNLATGGVYAVSLWPAGKGLKAVDYISFSLKTPI